MCYLHLLWQALMMHAVIEAMPIQFIDGKCQIMKWKCLKTALSSCYACVSRDLLMAMGQTHTHTYQCTNKNDFKKPGVRSLRLRVPGLKKLNLKIYKCADNCNAINKSRV